MTTKEIKENNAKEILLNPYQYRGFIKEWISHAPTEKLYNWDHSVFYAEYVKMLKQIAGVDRDYQYDSAWVGQLGIFDEDKIHMIENNAVACLNVSYVDCVSNNNDKMVTTIEAFDWDLTVNETPEKIYNMLQKAVKNSDETTTIK